MKLHAIGERVLMSSPVANTTHLTVDFWSCLACSLALEPLHERWWSSIHAWPKYNYRYHLFKGYWSKYLVLYSGVIEDDFNLCARALYSSMSHNFQFIPGTSSSSSSMVSACTPSPILATLSCMGTLWASFLKLLVLSTPCERERERGI